MIIIVQVNEFKIVNVALLLLVWRSCCCQSMTHLSWLNIQTSNINTDGDFSSFCFVDGWCTSAAECVSTYLLCMMVTMMESRCELWLRQFHSKIKLFALHSWCYPSSTISFWKKHAFSIWPNSLLLPECKLAVDWNIINKTKTLISQPTTIVEFPGGVHTLSYFPFTNSRRHSWSSTWNSTIYSHMHHYMNILRLLLSILLIWGSTSKPFFVCWFHLWHFGSSSSWYFCMISF